MRGERLEAAGGRLRSALTPQMNAMLLEISPGNDRIPQNRNQPPRPANVYRNMLRGDVGGVHR